MCPMCGWSARRPSVNSSIFKPKTYLNGVEEWFITTPPAWIPRAKEMKWTGPGKPRKTNNKVLVGKDWPEFCFWQPATSPWSCQLGPPSSCELYHPSKHSCKGSCRAWSRWCRCGGQCVSHYTVVLSHPAQTQTQTSQLKPDEIRRDHTVWLLWMAHV